MPRPIHLRVLLYNEGEFYIAQCLEYDIAAQGRSASKAIEAFQWVFYAQLKLDEMNDRVPFSHLEPAAEQFVTQFEEGIPLGVYPTIPTVESPAPQVTSIQEEFRLAA